MSNASKARGALSSALVMLGALVVFPVTPAVAQVCLPPLPCDESPTPSPSPSPSPPPSPSPAPSGSPSGTVTPAPPGRGVGDETPVKVPKRGGKGTDPLSALTEDPFADFPLEIPKVKRTPSRSSEDLVDLLAPLTERGMDLEEAMVLAVPPFPVAGLVTYSDDWLLPRLGPPPHLHQGTDIFAAKNTPIVASGPGTVKGIGRGDDVLGGNSVWIEADRGTGFFYTHFSSFAKGLRIGQRVKLGTVIGYVGNSGNAAGGLPHLHFEVHAPVRDASGRITESGVETLPDKLGSTNTPAVNPKPILDRWLERAEVKAEALVVKLIDRYSRVSRQVQIARRIDALYAGDPRSAGEMLWFGPLDSAGAGLENAGRLALEIVSAGRAGSLAEQRVEELRLARVRLAVERPRIALASMMGRLDSVF